MTGEIVVDCWQGDGWKEDEPSWTWRSCRFVWAVRNREIEEIKLVNHLPVCKSSKKVAVVAVLTSWFFQQIKSGNLSEQNRESSPRQHAAYHHWHPPISMMGWGCGEVNSSRSVGVVHWDNTSRRSSRSVGGTTMRLDEGEEHTVQTGFIDIHPNLSITTPASRLWGMNQKTRGIGARSPRSNKRSSYWATNRFGISMAASLLPRELLQMFRSTSPSIHPGTFETHGRSETQRSPKVVGILTS